MNIILTHTDFDGVVCGALLTLATKISFIKFVSTQKIWFERLTGEEVIADLPCPWKCRLWFDHHEFNLNEMKARGIDTDKIKGKFRIADSCSQIVYDYFSADTAFPEYFKTVVEETNKIDGMLYNSIEEWTRENPVKTLSYLTQFLNKEDYKSFLNFLIKLSKALAKSSPEELIQQDFIKDRYEQFKEYKDYSSELIKKIYYFHKNDTKHSIAILDISESKVPQRIDKNLIYLIEPNINAVLLINSVFRNNVKTNNLKFSFGINFTKAALLGKINLSTIFEEMEIGGGHPKAAGASLESETKEEKIRNKESALEEIIQRWTRQTEKNLINI